VIFAMPKKIKAIRKYKLKSGREKYEFSIRVNKNKIIHRRGFSTYDEAQLNYLNIRQQIINGDIEAEMKRIRYSDLYKQWLKRYKNTVKESTLNKTITIFNLHILPKFGNKYVDEITPKECQAAVDSWAESMAKYKFICNYADHIFKDAVRLKYLDKSPFDNLDVPKTTKHIKELRQQQNQNNFYNKQQLEIFLKAAKMFMPYKIYTFFRLLAYSGMRKGEILALTWSDIDFENKTVSIN
ncbi:site-specific integrase, partial [Lactobacillus sp. XV13L]|nr:site-specific integrase [Lactobacillus sp. XV13L]